MFQDINTRVPVTINLKNDLLCYKKIRCYNFYNFRQMPNVGLVILLGLIYFLTDIRFISDF